MSVYHLPINSITFNLFNIRLLKSNERERERITVKNELLTKTKGKFLFITFVTDQLSDVRQERRRQGHPASQVDVTFVVRWMRSSRKVVQTGTQSLRVQLVDGAGVPTPPPIMKNKMF